MALIALRELLYGGKVIAEGETFEASPRDTRTLIAVRRAKLVEEKAKAKPAKKADDDDDEPAKAAPAPKQQAYKTRRMTGRDND